MKTQAAEEKAATKEAILEAVDVSVAAPTPSQGQVNMYPAALDVVRASLCTTSGIPRVGLPMAQAF